MSKQSVLVPVETLERLIEAFDYGRNCPCFAGCEQCDPDNAPSVYGPIMTEKLWAIYLTGPDEYHAAPSEAAAHAMAENHNNWLKSEAGAGALKRLRLEFENCYAFVSPWPFEPEAHAADMADFDYAEWGLERD